MGNHTRSFARARHGFEVLRDLDVRIGTFPATPLLSDLYRSFVVVVHYPFRCPSLLRNGRTTLVVQWDATMKLGETSRTACLVKNKFLSLVNVGVVIISPSRTFIDIYDARIIRSFLPASRRVSPITSSSANR